MLKGLIDDAKLELETFYKAPMKDILEKPPSLCMDIEKIMIIAKYCEQPIIKKVPVDESSLGLSSESSTIPVRIEKDKQDDVSGVKVKDEKSSISIDLTTERKDQKVAQDYLIKKRHQKALVK